jgi:hypothetical protein
MSTIFLAGHGDWSTTDGYAKLPSRCSMTFYTEFSKNMFTADMLAIIGGTFTGTVKSKVGEYMTCPNYTLHGDTLNRAACQQLLTARNDPSLALAMWDNGSMTLSDIFAYYDSQRASIDFVWCACRFTGLKDAGGKTVGVNGAQGSYGNRNAQGQLAPNGANIPDGFYFNPSTANRLKPLS